MKTLGIHKAISIFSLVKLEPIYKAEALGNGKYKAKEVGKEEVPLVERGFVGIDAFFTARKTTLKKQMWAIVRVRRARVGQLRLL